MSTIGVKAIKYPDGDSAINITDGGNVTLAGTLGVTGETTLATHLNLGDNDRIKLGAGTDIQIYHDGTYSRIMETGGNALVLDTTSTDIRLTADNSKNMATFVKDGAVQLYHSNSQKFSTTSTGVTITGNIANASGNLTIDVAGGIILDADGGEVQLHDGGTEFVQFTKNSNDVRMTAGVQDGDIIFRGNDGGSMITALTLDMSEAGRATFNDNVNLGDTKKLVLGAGNDLQIYHDGSNSYIDEQGQGSLFIRGANTVDLITADGTEYMARFQVDGYNKLYHNGLEKLETTSSGVDITGTTTTDNLVVEGSGINFTVNQTANNLTANFKGAGLGTMELQGTASGGFIDIKQGTNDYDMRIGANNTGGYAAMGSGANGFSFNFADGSGSGTVTVSGTLNKTSGSFRISHPLESKKDTHHLFHSFVEGPQCDNLYRGKVTLSSGSATINLDTKSGMTDGTFVALNRDIQCFTTNETGWTPIKGAVSGNVLTITAQDNSCTDTISWLVIGERQDDEIKASSLTDDDGNLIVEKLKSESPDANQNFGIV